MKGTTWVQTVKAVPLMARAALITLVRAGGAVLLTTISTVAIGLSILARNLNPAFPVPVPAGEPGDRLDPAGFRRRLAGNQDVPGAVRRTAVPRTGGACAHRRGSALRLRRHGFP
jgi:hypothetical protein